VENRLSVADFKTMNDAKIFYEDEEIMVNGKLRTVRRLFVRKEDSDSDGVGWIINEDITACMVCNISFGMFRWPHHCRSCGNLVCHPCSPETAVLFEMKDSGEVRVCTLCYWGQDPVYISYHRRISRSSGSFGTLSADANNAEATQNIVSNSEVTYSHESPATPDCFTENEKKEYIANYQHIAHLMHSKYPHTKTITPEPAFVIELLQYTSSDKHNTKLYRHDAKVIYVNVCYHDCIADYSVTSNTDYSHANELNNYGAYFFVCPEVCTLSRNSVMSRPSTAEEEDLTQCDVYHAVVSPEAVKIDLYDCYDVEGEERESTKNGNEEVSRDVNKCKCFVVISSDFFLHSWSSASCTG
jgi:hypothetical protein